MRVAVPITLADHEREVLTKWSRGRSTPARLVLRAQIVLRAAEGMTNAAIAAELDTDRECVGRWRKRFAQEGIAGIARDAPRSGRKKSIPAATVKKVIRLATSKAAPNATLWSTRSLARATGISFKSVHRILQSQELRPHRVRTFKVSNDPHFVEKVTDIVGLYLNPPAQALVLCADEKSQIQALDRLSGRFR